MYLNAIGKSRLLALQAHYKENGCSPRNLKYKGRNKKAITLEEATRIVTFLRNFAAIHALALPGRVAGKHSLKITTTYSVNSDYSPIYVQLWIRVRPYYQ